MLVVIAILVLIKLLNKKALFIFGQLLNLCLFTMVLAHQSVNIFVKIVYVGFMQLNVLFK